MEKSFSEEREEILTIYRRAIHNWQEFNPGANPMKGIPDEMKMPRGSFYRKMRTGFRDDEQLKLFQICLYPQGFHQLAELARLAINNSTIQGVDHE